MFKIQLPKEGEEREKALVNLSWMLRGFLGCLDSNYSTGAPRHVEGNLMVVNLIATLKPELSEDEYEELARGLLNDDGSSIWS